MARFASALSQTPRAEDAVNEIISDVERDIGSSADLVICFVTREHVPNAHEIAKRLMDKLGTDNVFGCSAEAVAGQSREIEEGPALSVLAIQAPTLQVAPTHLEWARTAEGGAFLGWTSETSGEWPQDSFMIVLADPFTFPADHFVERMGEDRPGVMALGGMASAGSRPGENVLLFGPKNVREGGMVLRISGLKVRPVVSQGCRPIGRPFVITKVDRNAILELGGKPAIEQLSNVYRELPTKEQAILQRGLHIGRVVSEYRDKFEHGDFLIRNIFGLDQDSGGIVIGDFMKVGQTIQFHLRDPETASVELAQLLAKQPTGESQGALLFSCNGRGTRMFEAPDHDAGMIAGRLGPIPLAGFFAQGEIGPIGGKNFVHGFTASLAILE